jgi:hypothetical protein
VVSVMDPYGRIFGFLDRLIIIIIIIILLIRNSWPEPANELYRLSDRSFSEKFVPTFADRGVSRGQRGGSLRP